MYQSPDVIKVKVNIDEVFASYHEICPMDQFQQESYTIPCSPSDPNYTIVANTYIGLGWGDSCYSTQDGY